VVLNRRVLEPVAAAGPGARERCHGSIVITAGVPAQESLPICNGVVRLGRKLEKDVVGKSGETAEIGEPLEAVVDARIDTDSKLGVDRAKDRLRVGKTDKPSHGHKGPAGWERKAHVGAR